MIYLYKIEESTQKSVNFDLIQPKVAVLGDNFNSTFERNPIPIGNVKYKP